MNILVIGLGSMGKRRIRLIHEMYPEYRIFGVDAREDRQKEVTDLYQINCYSSIDEAKEQQAIDCVFICTSPISHSGIISVCLDNGWHVFTELNLVADGYDKNITLAKQNNCKLFLSSTFLYREEIRYIREKVSAGGKWNYIYHIGQYLPDWHPWENYKDFFVGEKRTNGCREIFAIELPWLIATFGNIKEHSVMADKITDLKIDYNDNYMIQIMHENGNKGTLIVDIVSPCAVRKMEAYAENKYLSWSGTPDSLMEYDEQKDVLVSVAFQEETEHKEGYRAFVVENAYKNEIKEFFDVVLNDAEMIYGFEKDREILKLIDVLEANE